MTNIYCRMIYYLALVDEGQRTREIYCESFDQDEVEAQKEQYSKQQDCTGCSLRVKCLIEGVCLKLQVLSTWRVVKPDGNLSNT
jgi:hypothetical protein